MPRYKAGRHYVSICIDDNGPLMELIEEDRRLSRISESQLISYYLGDYIRIRRDGLHRQSGTTNTIFKIGTTSSDDLDAYGEL
jgi:hypothetical protein